MKKFIYIALAVALFLPLNCYAAACDAGAPKQLSMAEMLKPVNARSADRHRIENLGNGRARIPAPLQSIEAVAAPDGVSVTSTTKEKPGSFGLRAATLGRLNGTSELIQPGIVSSDSSIARIIHSNLTEELTTGVEGVRQDFIIPAAPAGAGELTLELAVTGAESRLDGAAVAIALPGGRKLVYHRLLVSDSTGKSLQARFELGADNRIRIIVADSGAVYPVRIDPTIADTNWVAIATPATNNSITALAWDGTNLYAGGLFTSIAGVLANRVAKWDGSTWASLGGGMDNNVNALTWDGTSLYAGGAFTTAGGVAVNRIAKWDGSTWSALGSGVNNYVYALVSDGTNLYAGGSFTTAGGSTANRIAAWNGSAWSALGSGMDSTVYSLVRAGSSLYAGGLFTTAGGNAANYIAKWDGSAWSALGAGVGATVYALAWNGTNLYAGGSFTTAGGVASNRVAKWDGSTWSPLGAGMNSTVNALVWDGTNLHAGGTFTTAGGAAAGYIATWNGSAWSTLGTGMGSSVKAMTWGGTSLYAVGDFTTAGGVTANRIATWNGSTWSPLGYAGMDNIVMALAWDGSNLYAGGLFTTAGGAAANYVAKWNGSAWSPLGSGVNNYVYALTSDGTNLYAGGTFTTAGGVTVNRIAKWDGSAWSSLGSGMNGTVNTLLWDGAGNVLFAGGQFMAAGGITVYNIAKWDGSAWSALGSGLSGTVNALVRTGTHLYAGGSFSTIVGGTTANNIARWDGLAWVALGSGTSGTGVNNTVNALAWDGSNLYVGGSFMTIGQGGAIVNRIARWNGSAWSALESGADEPGVDNTVYSLAWDGISLYVGGAFTTAGGVTANRIARWNGSAWSALGSGMDSNVYALTPAGMNLYAGGAFASAGGNAARVASFKAKETVTYSINGGAQSTLNVSYGELATQIEPVGTSCNWYTDSELTSAFDIATPITSDVTVYGACYATSWISGSWSSCSPVCGVGTRNRSVACTYSDAGNIISVADRFCTEAKPATSEPCNILCVTYDGNGYTGGTPPVDGSSPYAAGSSVTVLDKGTLTRTGYGFSSWNTAANGSGSSYSAGDSFTINAATSLYAQWHITLTPPATGTPGANQVTLSLRSGATGTGYFTLLAGSGAACGSGASVKSGKAVDGTTQAYRYGSLQLTENTAANYTIRNLPASTDYTVCFTADDNGTNLNATPVTANLTTAAIITYPIPGWGAVGNSGFSDGAAYDVSLAFAPDGTPFVAFYDVTNSGRITVMKFSGTSWVAVGTPGFSVGEVSHTTLTFAPDGTPFAAFIDGGLNDRVAVAKFNGTAWIPVGGAGVSSGSASYVTLAFAPDTTPYVAFMDGSQNSKATVMKYGGTTWDLVGSAGFSAGGASYVSLALGPDGTPHVIFKDGSQSSKATAMKYGGSSWALVGNAGFSAGTVSHTTLAFAPDGSLHTAFVDSGRDNKATVMKFNAGVWELLGTPGRKDYYSSLSFAFGPDGNPYVAFPDADAGNRGTILRYGGSSWEQVGSADFSSGAASDPSLAFAPDGTPYVAYTDFANGIKASVMRLSPRTATTIAVSSDPNPSAYGASVTITATVSPFTATGSVIFKEGATELGTGIITAGSVSYTTATLAVGSHTITAVYSGDSGHVASTSSDHNQTVNKANSTVTVTGTTLFTYNDSPHGPDTSFVTGSTGTVTYSYSGTGSTSYGPSATKPTATGTYNVTATVASDANYNGASSGVTPFTIYIAYNFLTVNFAGSGQGSVLVSQVNNSWLCSEVTGSSCTMPLPTASSTNLSGSPLASSQFSGWSGDCVGTGDCLLSMNANHTVTALFTVKAYTITASAEANGSISLSGDTTVTYGGSQSYSITPNSGYVIAAVTIDGNPQTVANRSAFNYTFSNVTESHTISATFAVATYSVQLLGRCVSGPTTAAYDATPTYSFENAGFAVAVYVNGSLVPLENNSYSYNYTYSSGITSNQVISAVYTVLPGGTSATVKLVHGGDVTGKPSLQAAYDDAASGDVIMLKAGSTEDTLTAGRDISVTIKGGYDDAYNPDNCGMTGVGKVTVSKGSVRVDGLNVR